ncbi:patatin-like phospholipase family protein [Fibrobacter sp. UWB12]|uniref:patatin-like phospholipase family protein n=1 Tax=Fibrobacter sp. UWB12 TaxID=1896203 RepID=UPI000922901E|nr:patatin-like phospholipase family protein [Fibrobacter sp. UWB12]SHK76532.1 NTE family protein [Fibrobacter sp. UWB12]
MFPIPLGWLKKALLLSVATVASVYVTPVQAAHSADETLLSAMQLVPDSLQAKKTKSVLYLGGGERSPWFHLGALYALEEYKIPVDSIVATSWGAWMGALWSLGVSIDDIQRLMMDPYVIEQLGVNSIHAKTEHDAFKLPISVDGLPSLRERFSFYADTAGNVYRSMHALVPDTASIERSLSRLRFEEILFRQRGTYRIPFTLLTCDSVIENPLYADIVNSLPLAGNEKSGELCPYQTVPLAKNPQEASLIVISDPIRYELEGNAELRTLKKDVLTKLGDVQGVFIRAHSIRDTSRKSMIQAGFSAVEHALREIIPIVDGRREYSDKQKSEAWFEFNPVFDSLSSEHHSAVLSYWNLKDTGFVAPANFAYSIASKAPYDTISFNMQSDGSLLIDVGVHPTVDVAVGGFGSNVIGANAYGELTLNYVNQMEISLTLAGFYGTSSYGFRPHLDISNLINRHWKFTFGYDLMKLRFLKAFENDNVPGVNRFKYETRNDLYLSAKYAIDKMQSVEVKFLFGSREFELSPKAVPEIDFFDDEIVNTSSNYETSPVTQSVHYSLLNGEDDPWFASKGYAANASIGLNLIGYGFHQRSPIYGIYSFDGRFSYAPTKYTSVTVGAAMGFDAYRDGHFKFPKNFDNTAMEDRYRLHVAATPWSGDWLDPELSSHGYAMLRVNGGVHRQGFGAWLSFAYIHDFEDKATAMLNSNKFVIEPALRYAYRSFTVYAGLNRVVDTETFADIKRIKNYRYFIRIGDYNLF